VTSNNTLFEFFALSLLLLIVKKRYCCHYGPIKTECPENVRKMFRIIIYKFRILFIVQKMFQNVIVSDIRNLSGICPEFVQDLFKSGICPEN